MIKGLDEALARRLRRIINDPVLNEVLWLVHCGVPFDVAWMLEPEERFCWCVVMGRFEGAKFNEETFEWETSDGH